MSNAADKPDESELLAVVQSQAAAGNLRLTQHAASEVIARSITLEEIFQTLASSEVLENYAHHQRGPCCLISGRTARGRPLHIVCTTAHPELIIITVYEPQMPKWKSPRERNR